MSIVCWKPSACWLNRGSSFSSVNSPVFAPGKRWLWTFRSPLASKSFAPKSPLGFSGMWQEAQFSFACGG